MSYQILLRNKKFVASTSGATNLYYGSEIEVIEVKDSKELYKKLQNLGLSNEDALQEVNLLDKGFKPKIEKDLPKDE